MVGLHSATAKTSAFSQVPSVVPTQREGRDHITGTPGPCATSLHGEAQSSDDQRAITQV